MANAGFGIEKKEGSTFLNSRVDDALLYFDGNTRNIHIGAKHNDVKSSIVSVNTESNVVKTKFHSPVEVDSNILIHGNARIEGDFIVNGTTTTINTSVKTTDQLSIKNDGTGPALIVDQQGDQMIAQFMDDGVPVMSIADGGFIGLGTTGPIERLHVEGNVFVSSDASIDGSLNVNGLNQDRPAFTVNQLNDQPLAQFRTQGISKMTLDSKGLLGLGTVTPKEKLDVEGNTRISGDLLTGGDTIMEGMLTVNGSDISLNSDVSVGGMFSLSNKSSGPAYSIDQIGAEDIAHFKQNGEQVLTIADGGLVGIGIDQPTEKLHVIGNILGSSNIEIMGHAQIGGKLDVNKLGSSNLEIMGHTQIYGKLDVVGSNVNLNSDVFVKGTFSLSNNDFGPAYRVDQIGGEDIAYFMQDGKQVLSIMNGGLVGIGVDQPKEKLHVVGNILGSSNLDVLGNAQIDGNFNVTGSNMNLSSDISVGGSFKLSNNDSGPAYSVDQIGAEDIAHFKQDGKQVLSIVDGGLVGIGIDQPEERLHVVGNILGSSNLDVLGDARVVGNLDVVGSNVNLSSEVHVKGSFTLSNTNTGPAYTVNQVGAEDVAHFKQNGKQVFSIVDGGLVGIGIDQPKEKLHVIGNILCSSNLEIMGDAQIDGMLDVIGANVNLKSDVYVGGSFALSNIQSGPAYSVDQIGSEDIAQFKQDGKQVLSIANGGLIGIGIDQPKEKLHVIGNILSSSNLHIMGDAQIDGNFNFNGWNLNLNSDVSIGGSITLSNSSTGPAISIDQIGDEDIAHFKQDGKLVLTVADGGQVGIGIDRPREKLHVVGNILGSCNLEIVGDAQIEGNLNVSGSNFTLKSDMSLLGSLILSNNDLGPAIVVDQAGSENVAFFQQNGIRVFNIMNGGLVGIGVDQPQEKLHVVGNILGSSNLEIGGSAQFAGNVNVNGAEVQLSSDVTVDGQFSVTNSNEFGPAITVDQNRFDDIALFRQNGDPVLGIVNGGFVGIGTHQPNETLHVIGGILASQNLETGGNTQINGDLQVNGLKVEFNSIVSVDGRISLVNNAAGPAYQIDQIGAEDIAYFMQDGVRMMSIIRGGSVGIGIEQPEEKLHVVGNIIGTQNLQVGGSTKITGNLSVDGLDVQLNSDVTVEGQFLLTNSNLGPAFRFNQMGSENIGYFQQNGVNVLSIIDGGAVGIGTDSPNEKLHVIGNIVCSQNIESKNNATIGVDLQVGNNVQIGNDLLVNDFILIRGDARIEGNLTVKGDMTRLDTEVRTTEQMMVTNDGTGPALVVNQLGSEVIAQFQDDNIPVLTVVDGGLVGIGTDQPDEKLHIVGNVLCWNLEAQGNIVLGSNITVKGKIQLESGNDSPDFFITDGGLLGVGTNQPEEKLHVIGNVLGSSNLQIKGNTQLDGNLNVDGSNVNLNSDVSVGGTFSLSNQNAGPAMSIDQTGSEDIAHFKQDGSNVVSIVDGGSVGIGTDQPQEKLHVLGNILGSGTLHTGGSAFIGGGLTVDGSTQFNADMILDGKINVINNNTGPACYIDQKGPEDIAHFLQNGNSVLSIVDGGSVGIGTDQPQEKLHIVGNVLGSSDLRLNGDTQLDGNLHVDGSNVNLNSDVSVGGTFSLSNQNAGPAMSIDQTGSEDIAHFKQDGSNVVSIVDGGSVGIGTNTPTAKLHVIGNILASGNVTSMSDKRMKENISVINSALEKVKKINGYTFTYKNADLSKEGSDRHMGVLAQELIDVIPEVVAHDSVGDKYSVAYGNIVGVLIEAIKDLSQEVDILKKKE